MKTLLVLLIALTAMVLCGQDGTPVNDSQGPPWVSYSTILKYSGSDLIATCEAKSQQPTATFIISGTTPYALTNIVVLTNVGTVTTASAHGLGVNDKIVIAGATIDTDLNGTYKIATVGSTTTFTIATVAVADATYTEAGLKFTTNAPRTTQPIWSISKFALTASVLQSVKWANGTAAMNQICDNSVTLPAQ